MIVDAEHLPSSTLPPFDLCVVGAGAAGIALTTALRGSGLRICLLESGGTRLDPWRQSLADAEAHGQPYFPAVDTRARCLGGSTVWWNGECRPLDATEDLAPRPWLEDPGWPFPAEELLRFYPGAQDLCGLGPEPFDPAEPLLSAAGLAPLPLDGARFVTRLFRYAPVLDFAKLHGPTLREAGDVTVLLHAHVAAVDTSADGRRATGVTVKRRNAPDFHLAASVTVLATGGIENARLLLLSGPAERSGLGNGHDLVGRYFMEHLFLDDVAPLTSRLPANSFRPYFRRVSAGGVQLKAALSPTAALLAETGLPNLTVKLASAAKRAPGIVGLLALRDGLISRHPGMARRKAARLVLSDLPGAARALAHVASRREMGTAARPEPLLASVVAEQMPNPASRITLSERRDGFGQPLARLDWFLLERDRAALWRALELLRDELDQSGLGRLTLPDPPAREQALASLRGGRHHMGTTRMALLPRHGVVDSDCRVHGMDNLFIAGSSVFPSSGHANPTLTIVALALRLAERIRRDARDLRAS